MTDYWQRHIDANMEEIKKQLKENGIDPDYIPKNLEETLEIFNKMEKIRWKN